MRRVACFALILTVLLPAVFAYAASFNISYSGSTVVVVPIEDVVTERIGAPAKSTAANAGGVMISVGDSTAGLPAESACQAPEDGGASTGVCTGKGEPVTPDNAAPKKELPSVAPTPTPIPTRKPAQAQVSLTLPRAP